MAIHSTEQQVRRALRKMTLARLVTCLSITLMAAALAAVMLVGVVKLTPAPEWIWGPLPLSLLGGAALIAGAIWTWLRRPTRQDAALALDQRLGLQERVSTAMATAGSSDPFALAVQADAAEQLRGRQVNSHFRLRPTPMMGLWIVPVVAAMLVALAPRVDFSPKEGEDEEAARRLQISQQAVQRVNRVISRIRKSDLPVSDGDLAEKLAELETFRPRGMNNPKRVIGQALTKVNQMIKDLEKADIGEQMKDLRTGQPGAVRNLIRAMQRGDFKDANELLRKLTDIIAANKKRIKDPDMQKLLEQLRKLAQQMQRKGCEDALKQAMKKSGMSEQQRKRVLQTLSREDLDREQKVRDALKKQGLTKQQIEQLMQQMKQAARNNPMNKMGQCMSGACSKMDGSPSPSDVDDALDQMSGAGSALSDLEKMQEQLDQLKDALQQQKEDLADDLSDLSEEEMKAEMNPGECDGDGQGDGQGEGEGQGKPGKNGGGGDAPPVEENPTAGQRTQVAGQVTPGKAIAHSFVQGDQVKGESRAELVDIMTAEQKRMADPTVTEELPRQLHDIIKNYLDQVQKPAQRSEEGE